MRRASNLFPQIASRDNLRLAFWKALRGKRAMPDAREFAADQDRNLQQMADWLRQGCFPLGKCRQFTIYDPKERLITAPCFRERVLHHAIMNVCEPVFERFLIDHTFACRRGKGRLAALERARRFASGNSCFLKMDVRKYFDSVPHSRLFARLQRIFKDSRLLDLLGQIIESHRHDAGRGLPIGSLTSQHFANFYLGFFDRFVKERLRIKGYVRYMDDFVMWSDSTRGLKRIKVATAGYLSDELDLQVKRGSHINRTGQGLGFLGCRVYPGRLELNKQSRLRFRRKLRALEAAYHDGQLEEAELQRRVAAMVAFTRTPALRSWKFRQAVLQRS